MNVNFRIGVENFPSAFRYVGYAFTPLPRGGNASSFVGAIRKPKMCTTSFSTPVLNIYRAMLTGQSQGLVLRCGKGMK